MKTTIVIHALSDKNLSRTINSLIDNTNNSNIAEIIICYNGIYTYEHEKVKILRLSGTSQRSAAFNAAMREGTGDVIIFFRGVTKFSEDWLPPIIDILSQEPNALVSPIIYMLDSVSWQAQPNHYKRFGFRYDLNLYNRPSDVPTSPAISSFCIAANKSWLTNLGGFDEGMQHGDGEDIELSIRNWLSGGRIFIADESVLSCDSESVKNYNNISRIIELYLAKYSSYCYAAIERKANQLSPGRLSKRQELNREISIEDYLISNLPELTTAYRLSGIGHGKRLAIVGPGFSIDCTPPSIINQHDIIIGIDYMGLMFNCDYIITDSVSVLVELRSKYTDDQFMLPMMIDDNRTGRIVTASALSSKSMIFELDEIGSIPIKEFPPFVNCHNLAATASHIAIFMNPSEITLFGCDTKIMRGKSHTSRIANYNNGLIWTDNETTRRSLAYTDYILNSLSHIAYDKNIPMLRYNHI